MRNAVLEEWRASAQGPPLRAVLMRDEPNPGAAGLDAQVAALAPSGARCLRQAHDEPAAHAPPSSIQGAVTAFT